MLGSERLLRHRPAYPGHRHQRQARNLTTTALGQGHGDSATCTFTFGFPITEGQDRYVVSVGHRGEFSYSFAQLQNNGVAIQLGH